MFDYKLNDRIFVADVYDRDTKIGYIYFKLIIYKGKVYAEEIFSKIIFPISSEIYRASLYELVNGTKYQFYVNTFSELRISNDGNIYGSNISKWKSNLAAKEINFNDISDYCNGFIHTFDYIIKSDEIIKLNELIRGEESMERYYDNDNNYVTNIEKESIKKVPKSCKEMNSRTNLTNVVGREKEIRDLIKVSCILGKSVILLGEAGVGKTAIVDGLVNEINQTNKQFLKDKIVYELNTGSLLAGTKYRGEFEEKLEDVIKFAQKYNQNVILFIDEIHTLYNLGRTDDSPIDAINILKSYIEKGEITIIGATTYEEYDESIARDKAFASRLTINNVKPLDNRNVQLIIMNYILLLERKYNIKVNLTEDELISLTEELINVAKHQDARYKILPIRIIKRIVESAFAEAIYEEHSGVELEDFISAILDSNELKLKDKKEYALSIKNKLNSVEPQNNHSQNNKLYVLSSK